MTTDPVGPTIEWRTLSIHCADADAMATFYTSLLGWEVICTSSPYPGDTDDACTCPGRDSLPCSS